MKHLIREIGPQSVVFWCGRLQPTKTRVPGKPDVGELGQRQLAAWRKAGQDICESCAQVAPAPVLQEGAR